MKYSQLATRLFLLLGGAVPMAWICVLLLPLIMMHSVESFQLQKQYQSMGTPTTTRTSSSPSSLLASLAPHYTQGHHVDRHPHDGVATPWPILGNPCVELDAKAEKTLARGKPYRTIAHFQVLNNDNQQKSSSTISRRLIVQDVQAPVKTIIDRILDYNQYSKMVPGISQSEIYHRETIAATTGGGDGSGSLEDEDEEQCAAAQQQRLGVRMKAGVPFMQFEFYTDIRYDPRRHSISWTLDYSRHSQVYESVGMWYIQPRLHHHQHANEFHERNEHRLPCWSRVYYAAEHTLFKSAPKQVQYLINQSSLKDGVSWVKKESEKMARQHQEEEHLSLLSLYR